VNATGLARQMRSMTKGTRHTNVCWMVKQMQSMTKRTRHADARGMVKHIRGMTNTTHVVVPARRVDDERTMKSTRTYVRCH
jgi:hypothetical protein